MKHALYRALTNLLRFGVLKRQINAGEIVRDLRSGVGDADLMDKYKLSPIGLERLFRELVEGDLIDPADLHGRWSSFSHNIILKENRRAPRAAVNTLVPIHEKINPDSRGIILNISETGLKVRHLKAKVNEIKSLTIPTDRTGDGIPISFDAVCRWIKIEEDGSYASGFEIATISPTELESLRTLIQALPSSEKDKPNFEILFYDAEGTQTVDLSTMFSEEVTSTGSYRFSGVERTWFGKLLQAMPIPVLLINRSCHIRFMNQSCEKISSDYKSMEGKSVASLFSDTAKAYEIIEIAQKVFATRKRVSCQAWLQVGDNRIWSRLYFQSVRMGSERAILLLIEDRTHEKEQLFQSQKIREQLEHRVKERTVELVAKNEQLQREIAERKKLKEERDRLFNLSIDMMCIADFEGYFKQLNPAWEKTLGWTNEELTHRKWFELIHPDDREATREAGKQLQIGIPVYYFENRYLCKDGSYRWFSWDSFPVQEEQLIFSVVRDITDRKQLEEQLRQAAKMEAIGRLAGGVAHEFNNLLTAIMGYSNLMLNDIPQDNPQRDRILKITRSAERAAGLTRQLLAYGRKQVLDVQMLDLNEEIDELKDMIRQFIGEQIVLVTNFDNTLGKVQADPGQIEQILMNLVVNARDAMPKGGTLTIETGNTYLGEDYCRRHDDVKSGRYAMFSIDDSGTGMDQDTLSRVFDPFFTTKDKGMGTGLGLSTVYGIVKQHHGHISVKSEPGKGSCFNIYLPIIEDVQEKAIKVESIASRPSGIETVLVVEDETVVRDLICEALQMLGYSTISAEDAEQAIAIADEYEGRIHLLVTDMVLPKMDGRSLYDNLFPKRPDMKALFMSAYSESFITNKGFLDPSFNFMEKPFSVELLANRVRAVLDFNSNK